MVVYILVKPEDISYIDKFPFTHYHIFSFFDLLTETIFYVKISKKSKIFEQHIDKELTNDNKLLISINASSVYLNKKLYHNARIINGSKFEEIKNNFPEFFYLMMKLYKYLYNYNLIVKYISLGVNKKWNQI